MRQDRSCRVNQWLEAAQAFKTKPVESSEACEKESTGLSTYAGSIDDADWSDMPAVACERTSAFEQTFATAGTAYRSKSMAVTKWFSEAEVFKGLEFEALTEWSVEDVVVSCEAAQPEQQVLVQHEGETNASSAKSNLPEDSVHEECASGGVTLDETSAATSSAPSLSATSQGRDQQCDAAVETPQQQFVPKPPSSPRPAETPSVSCLASRRKLETDPTTPVASSRSSSGCLSRRRPMRNATDEPREKQTIKMCNGFTFSDFYEIGDHVMPSSNAGMAVLFATRISDGLEVVVKTREKSKSFKSYKGEEKEWRKSMQILLNVPVSENIAQLYDVYEDFTYYYIVMEKVAGLDLYEGACDNSTMSIEEIKDILYQLLLGLSYLHAAKCIHKDLKLENIMMEFTKQGDGPGSPRVKLIDFDTVEECTSTSLRAKRVVGTDQYIAPEGYAGRYSAASDMFSVGVIAYKLISGNFPFDDSIFDDQPGENWVGNPKMAAIRNRLRCFTINWEGEPWTSAPDALDLTRSMLLTNHDDRPSAEEALNHPFFDSIVERLEASQ